MRWCMINHLQPIHEQVLEYKVAIILVSLKHNKTNVCTLFLFLAMKLSSFASSRPSSCEWCDIYYSRPVVSGGRPFVFIAQV